MLRDAVRAGAGPYTMLMASLPYLPHFERAQRLPINRQRLDERLGLLRAQDRLIVQAAEDFLQWQRQARSQTDAQVVARYREVQRLGLPAALRQLITFRMALRTVLAALRARQAGAAPPRADDPLAGAPMGAHILRNWTDPDFRLGHRHRWLPVARTLLERGDARALERHLLRVVWNELGRAGAGHYFDLDAVLVYLFRWDILDRWLRYDSALARTRIARLAEQATGPHPRGLH